MALSTGFSAQGTASTQERGDYFVRNFLPGDYGAFFQCWGLTQDRRGLIYVGNSDGVLEYDGARWRLIPTARQAVARSLAYGSDGRIYVGGSLGEIGYLNPGSNGELRYVSLVDRVDPADRQISDVQAVLVLKDSVYFQAAERIIRFSGNEVRTWKPTRSFGVAFLAHDRLYVRDSGRGLLVLDDNELKLIPGGERFLGTRVQAVIPWDTPEAPNRALLIATYNQGLFLAEGEKVASFPTRADAVLRAGLVNHALLLSDGSLAVATLQSGLLLIDRNGDWLGRVGKAEGLLIDSVKTLFQDSQLGLWMSLGKGIARVEIQSPVSRFDERRGLRGVVFAIFRHRGVLYVGTDQGLFRLDDKGVEGSHFIQIDGVKGAVWSFVSHGENLIVAAIDGVFEVKNNEAVQIWQSPSVAYHLMFSRRDPSRLYVGVMTGVGSLRWQGGRWIEEGMIPDLNIHSRSFYEDDDGSLWVGTFVQGIVHTSFPTGRNGKPVVEWFGTDQGLPSLRHTYVNWLAGGLKASSHAGIYRFRKDLRRFEPDPAFAGLFNGECRWVYALKEDRAGNVWMHSNDEVKRFNEPGVAQKQPDGTYRWRSEPSLRIAGLWVVDILPDENGVVWFGGSDGLFRLDPTVHKEYGRTFRVLIRQCDAGKKGMIFGGYWAGQPLDPAIPFADNRLRFEFATPSFDLNSANQYQLLLEGYDTDWSAWSSEASKEYLNLSEGRYRFRVRARNAYGIVGSDAQFGFRILPPWSRTWWAYILWVLGGGGVLIGIIYFYTANLRHQKVILEQLVDKRTQQLHEATLTDSLTGLRNRRFMTEVLQDEITAFISSKKYLTMDKDKRKTAIADAVFGIFIVDIDFFKRVNDTYGHEAGDRVLKQFGAILRDSVRQDDVIMRIGGEEFLVVLKKTRPEYLHFFASRLLERVAALAFDIGRTEPIRETCSIGYTMFPVYGSMPDLLTFEQSTMIADMGMYQAKKNGRDQAVYLAAGANSPSGEAVLQKTVTSLDLALHEGFLQMEYRRNPLKSTRSQG